MSSPADVCHHQDMTTSLQKILIVFLLWFAGLGAAAQFAKIAVPFSSIQEIYPEIGVELGWLLSLVSLIGAILGISAGGLVGRFGARRILLVGMCLGALISIWQASYPEFHIMLLSRVVEGLSHLAIVVAAPTLIAQISPKRFRGAAMVLWSTFFGVSFALIALLGNPIMAFGGLKLLFVTHGMFMLVVASLLAINLKQVHQIGSNGTDVRSFMPGDFFRLHFQAYRSPAISAPGIGWLFYTLTFVSLLTILPQRLPDDSSVWVAGLIPLVAIGVSLLVVPVLQGHLNSIGIVILGFGCSILIALLALYGVSLVTISIVLFAALGLVQGASFSAVPELNSAAETQALSYGVMAQLGNTGNLIGMPLLLFILGLGGNAGMFAFIAIIYAFAILAHVSMLLRRV